MNPPRRMQEEVERLRERSRKLALEKSWLQLIINLMNQLSISPGLESIVTNMTRSMIDLIGGINAILYYFMDGKIHYADAMGERGILERIEDPEVAAAIDKRELREVEHPFEESRMEVASQGAALSECWSWILPLQAGDKMIGALKIERMHIGVKDLRGLLPTFFNYAALVLNNEIQSHSRLRQAYDQLSAANLELQRAKEEAEAASRAKSAFLAAMSHELRTPLNAVLGFSQLMQSDSECTRSQHERLDIINRSGRHLLTLINDILDMSKIEAGHMQLETAPFDLGRLVRDVIDMMRVRAEQKGLKLELDQSSLFPRFVAGDAAKLRQVLINLLSNAVKFTEQGSVELRLRAEPAAAQHQELYWEVRDSGIGIPLEQQEAIFQPFVQLGASGDQAGTGLGLALTRQFVELMGGDLSVESRPGVGSVFRFTLPARLVSEEEANQLAAAERTANVVGVAPGQPQYRLLIVEDQAENRVLLRNVLERVGLTTAEAFDGRQAIAQFQHWRPHLIWMDCVMPGMDGMEATRSIRELPGGEAVKIVALTASAFEEERERILAAGMDDYISKPFRIDEIFECLQRLLGIEFLCAQAVAEPPAAPATLSSERLACLPPSLCESLSEAVASLDLERCREVLHDIGAQDAELAAVLQRHIDRFEFQRISDALEGIAVK